jgi:hypothetical protein
VADDPKKTPPDAPDEDVPRLGRGRRRKVKYFPPGEVISIFALLIGLFAVIALKDSCARGAGGLLKAFDAPPDGGAAGHTIPRPSLVPPPVAPENVPTVPMAPPEDTGQGTPTMPGAEVRPPLPGEGVPPGPPGAGRLPSTTSPGGAIEPATPPDR